VRTIIPKQRQQTDQLTRLKAMRRNVVVALIGAIFFASFFIILAPIEQKTFYSDIIEPTSTAIAAGLSLLVVYRQKLDGLIGKAYFSLAVALLLWLSAEVIWSCYETGLGIPIPTPSLRCLLVNWVWTIHVLCIQAIQFLP
jgi:hypothetical protein